MAKGCVNGTLVEDKYSSPVPVIGLYIAAGSAVCFFFMLFDIISAFRHRKRWIPCRLFSLNSVTLTLLGICAKLPVDLTTPMPGVHEQLSKLTATTLICISMGFLNPSVGDNRNSGSLTNLAALSILVITVIVNICMQISTGLIYLFIVEHVMIICCMFVLLLLVLHSTLEIIEWKEVSLDSNKDFITKGEGSLLQRLKFSYIHGFNSNPQLATCLHILNCTIDGICLICFGVLTQAVLRSLVLKQSKFCRGTSDYDWTVWIIVVTQIITIIAGCFTTSFRLFTMFGPSVDSNTASSPEETANTLIASNPILGAHSWHMCGYYLKILLEGVTVILMLLIVIPAAWFLLLTRSEWFTTNLWSWHDYRNKEVVQEFKHLIGEGEMQLDEWRVWKAAEDMKSWMEASKRQSKKHLSALLSRTNPSQQLRNMELKDRVYPDQEGIQVSSLSMALLVRIAAFVLPHNLTKSLEETFTEAYEIVDYIESRLNSVNQKHRMKSKLTKAVLLGDGFHFFLPKIIERSTYRKEFHSQSELVRALVIIKELKNTMDHDFVQKEVAVITDLINRRDYGTIKDLYDYIEQIFVDMLHLFLAQFPNVVLKDLNESHAEEFEERVRFALKLICKTEALESQVE